MNIEKLVKMANDIADFFNAEPDKELAAEGVKKHIMRSWDPRMKKEIINYYREGGANLHPLTFNAIKKLADTH